MTAGEAERPVVLVADDEPDLLSLVRYALEDAGYEVVTATDGDEALRIAQSRALDAAVLDVRMPKLSGLEVTGKLRGSPATEQTPVMLLTAATEKEDVARGFKAGAHGYIEKPFSPWELVQRVDALVDR
jgi:DNA-binding response OmpR family regulator